jgi:DNA modification methylase
MIKTVGRTEAIKGFISIPTKNRDELVDGCSLPFETLVNGMPARIDQRWRIWCSAFRGRLSPGNRVIVSIIQNGFKVELREVEESRGVVKAEKGEKPTLEAAPYAITDIPIPVDEVICNRKILYDKYYRPGYDVVLACNDVLEFLKDFPDNTATLIVTSPPYNIGKPYEDRVELRDYLNWQREVIKQCISILSPEGSICWEVGNYVEDGEVFPLDVFFYEIFKDFGLKLRNRIVWHFEHGLHASKRLSGRYETILWFSKSEDYTFNLDSVRVPQKYPGKRAYKGPRKGEPSSHPLGKNPSDVWEILAEDWKKGMWNIPNVKCNHPEKTLHPSQFPIELVERLVLALTNEGDTVLDPFVGVGSSIIAAISQNRRGIGVDREKMYTDIAYQRVCKALGGTLKRRPLGKPIYRPKGTEKVARIPPEWETKSLSAWSG